MVIVESVVGLGVETLLIAPVMLGYLLWFAHTGTMNFLAHDGLLDLLLIASGAFTAIPLVMFAYGVRRVALSTIGVMQYVGQMLQLLTGVLLYREGRSEEHTSELQSLMRSSYDVFC